VIGLVVGILFNNFVLTGEVVEGVEEGRSSYTRAICDSNKKCIDVLVRCDSGKVVDIEPVSDLKEFGSLEDFELNRGEFC